MSTLHTITGGALALMMLLSAGTALAASPLSADMLGLTDDQFEALQEARELRKSGDHEGARELIEEADINLEELKEAVKERREEARAHREEVRAAVDAGDYDAFVDAVGDGPFADKITSEEDFDMLIEARELREAGDHEGAREILDELGIEKRDGHKKPGRFGGHRGGDLQ